MKFQERAKEPVVRKFCILVFEIQASRVSHFWFLGNALWDMHSEKVSTNSWISAITDYSFQLRVCLPLICTVFFNWNTSFLHWSAILWTGKLIKFLATYVFHEKKSDKTLSFESDVYLWNVLRL